jgi:hypothetical protein
MGGQETHLPLLLRQAQRCCRPAGAHCASCWQVCTSVSHAAVLGLALQVGRKHAKAWVDREHICPYCGARHSDAAGLREHVRAGCACIEDDYIPPRYTRYARQRNFEMDPRYQALLDVSNPLLFRFGSAWQPQCSSRASASEGQCIIDAGRLGHPSMKKVPCSFGPIMHLGAQRPWAHCGASWHSWCKVEGDC